MSRGRWQGMLAIARFNWPFYVVASLVFVIACVSVFWFQNGWVILAALLAMAGSGYFIFVSLGVSHLIYDRSDLHRWEWLGRLSSRPEGGRMVFCHSGFDEASEALAQRFEGVEWKVLDHYDPATMTEASIRRARALYPPTTGTLSAPFYCWPVADGWADVVFGMLAIHELRTVEERSLWFEQAGRCLGDGGKVVIVEHVRDVANFLAFGPGFLHFHSVNNWQRSWETAGLGLIREFRITPWIRVFEIGKR